MLKDLFSPLTLSAAFLGFALTNASYAMDEPEENRSVTHTLPIEMLWMTCDSLALGPDSGGTYFIDPKFKLVCKGWKEKFDIRETQLMRPFLNIPADYHLRTGYCMNDYGINMYYSGQTYPIVGYSFPDEDTINNVKSIHQESPQCNNLVFIGKPGGYVSSPKEDFMEFCGVIRTNSLTAKNIPIRFLTSTSSVKSCNYLIQDNKVFQALSKTVKDYEEEEDSWSDSD